MPTVTLHTRPFCQWCLRAKWLLWRQGVTWTEIDASSPEARAALEARTGRRTVPQVFVGDVHVGGYDDLSALVARGGLAALLAGG